MSGGGGRWLHLGIVVVGGDGGWDGIDWGRWNGNARF